MRLSTEVNREPVEVEIAPEERLIDLLRGRLGLTGTKEGCAEGECGACTVLVEGRPVNACLMFALQVRGRSVVTVEGLSAGGKLSLLQQKFVESGAIQCGYCTPGMLMSAAALLAANPAASREDIRAALAGNLCRCTGYEAIVEAVAAAAAGR